MLGIKERKTINFKKSIKWLCLALLLVIGMYIVFYVPAAVESFLPVVSTVEPEKAEYCKTVQGSGLITDENGLWLVTVAVNESEIRLVSEGQSAVLNGAAFDDGVYTAKVIGISDTAKQVAGANGLTIETIVEVVLEIDNPDNILRSGYTAQAVIGVEEPREVLVIPYEVICQDNESEFVYVLNGNSIVRRNITTGAELPEGAELISGLRETDEIITMPDNITGVKLAKK